jgi:subtilase family serine protease
VNVHLKLPNQALFSRTVDALYDRRSPTFHHWLSDAQLRQFGPPPAALAAVRSELERNGLSITSIANDGFSIRARGTIAAIDRTFHTEIHQFSLNGKSFQRYARPPALSGAAGAYVSLVSGLESHTVEPTLVHAIAPTTREPVAPVPLSKVLVSGLSSLITDDILAAKQSFTYTTNGKLPNATYTGVVYDPVAYTTPDYTPKQLEQVYGLNAAYGKGLDGAGQTIVLLEGYGYPTALSDANAFFKLTGLPLLNASNFSIVYPEGVPNPQAGILTGWDIEIALDIQWVHSIAPGAKILVVATNGQDSQDFEASMQYIIDRHLGYAVSDSWESDQDFFAGPDEQRAFEDVLTAAAAKGISFQFSTGDSGDGGLGTPLGAPGVPSVAPHATAVGGTAIVNVPGKSTFESLGWGDDVNAIIVGTPVVPPTLASLEAFFGGGGGGESRFWAKPAWQRALPGTGRQTPDISALSDPYTGVPIVITKNHTQQVSVGWGGTSLACPIFTAIWAISDQRAGRPLGQAAPTIARLTSGVTDVLPGTTDGFSGSITGPKGTTKYTSGQLFAQLHFRQKEFLPTIWNIQFDSFVIALGGDTSLTVGTGWDNVTGYGTPAGLSFIDAAAAY